MLAGCRDGGCLVSLKTGPMEDHLAVRLKYLRTCRILQIANPLDKLVRGGWTTLFLNSHHHFSLGVGSPWGGVLQHAAHLVLPGDCWC